MLGLFGKKKGMTQIFDEAGKVLGVTVVEIGPCSISRIKTVASDGYNAVQITFGKKKKEYRVEKPEEYTVGQELKVDLFKVGDYLKISGTSIGKGFAGRIKRWHQHRGPMSHGSKFHRIPGSIGSGTTPGRVWKGKQMAGRMGGCQVTNPNIAVVQIIPDKNLLLVYGSVPGKKGNIITVRKSSKTKSVPVNSKNVGKPAVVGKAK